MKRLTLIQGGSNTRSVIPITRARIALVPNEGDDPDQCSTCRSLLTDLDCRRCKDFRTLVNVQRPKFYRAISVTFRENVREQRRLDRAFNQSRTFDDMLALLSMDILPHTTECAESCKLTSMLMDIFAERRDVPYHRLPA